MDRQSGTAAAAEDDYNNNVDISNSNQCTDCSRVDDSFSYLLVWACCPSEWVLMLVPLVCFVYLLSLLMKLNTIRKTQLSSLSRTLAEESMLLQFGLIQDRILISKWQNTNFLLISIFNVHNSYSPIQPSVHTLLNFSSLQYLSGFV